jgi:mono/diheme cytochrome c family protein
MRVLLAAIVAAAAAAAAAFWFGAYNVAATAEHFAVTHWLLDRGMLRSVKQRARLIAVPPLTDPAQIRRGVSLFREHCVQCHGAPGTAPAPFALGMTPAPANLVYTAREWQPQEIFWTIKNGTRMTGMPAWEFRLSDEEIWAIVAFSKKLPELSPQTYREMKGEDANVRTEVAASADVNRGRIAINQYACTICHAIPGVVGPNAPVGPPLAGIARRAILAGVLPNTPDNMVRWLRAPQDVSPLSAMPNLGVSARDARDIAAYLATLK